MHQNNGALEEPPCNVTTTAQIVGSIEYNARARILTLKSPIAGELPKQERLPGTVAIVSAGTADMGVAEECRIIAEQMGCFCFKLYDVGTSGIQRILNSVNALRAADVIIVVAGLDGALPSVVAGLVEAPVVSSAVDVMGAFHYFITHGRCISGFDMCARAWVQHFINHSIPIALLMYKHAYSIQQGPPPSMHNGNAHMVCL